MSPRTPRGQAIAQRTSKLAGRLSVARVRYWEALLRRPQMAAPIVHAVREDLDTARWDRRLSYLRSRARRWIETRRAAERDAYLRSVQRTAQWLANTDRACAAADACHDAIDAWARREVGQSLQSAHGMRRPRLRSRAWLTYWTTVCNAQHLRRKLRNDIVEANDGLASHFIEGRARWMQQREESSLTRDDLMQHAREGLHRAADLYDVERGYAFSTYAMHWIRHHVERAFQTTSRVVRVPIAVQALGWKISKLLELDDELDIEQLAKRLGVKPERVEAALGVLAARPVSTDQPVSPGSSQTVGELLVDPSADMDEVLDSERIRRRLAEALAALPPSERIVLEARFGFEARPKSTHALARAVGCSRSDVDLIEANALASLREVMGA